jgi:hypothetical protein
MRGMNRILMFVFLVIVSAGSFYIAYGLDPSVTRQISPIKTIRPAGSSLQ